MYGFIVICAIGAAICYFVIGIKTSGSIWEQLSDAVRQAVSFLDFLIPAMIVSSLIAGILDLIALTTKKAGFADGFVPAILGVFLLFPRWTEGGDYGGLMAIMIAIVCGFCGIISAVKAYKLAKTFEK